MAAIHTVIPVDVLPTELAAPNIISAEYESFTLIPRLGPLSYAYYRRRTRGIIHDLVATLDLIGVVAEYVKEWEVEPAVPTGHIILPDVFLAPEIVGNIVNNSATPPQQPTRNPRENLTTLRRLNSDTITHISRALTSSSGTIAVDNSRVAANAAIISRLAQPNAVIARLVDNGLLLGDKGIVDTSLLDKSQTEQLKTVIGQLRNKGARPRNIQKTLATHLVESIVKDPRNKLGSAGITLAKDADLRNNLAASVAEHFKNDWVLDSLDSIDDSVIADSREWAFLRHERVELALGTPQLRGPVAAHSIAPNSELTLTKSQSYSSETSNLSLNQSSRRLTGQHLIANQIKQRIGTLYDYGSNLGQTMSEQGHERDTSRGEKRTQIESVLNEISEANASQTLSTTSVAGASQQEYTTQGKDTDFATSEIAFEAFSPVSVTHYLDGISAVWCPRISNPYQSLYEVINNFADEVRSDYIKENFVADPAEPLATYEGLEKVTQNTPKVRDSQIEDDTTYEHTVIIRLSEAEQAQNYFLADDVRCSFKQDDDWDTDALESNQYRVLEPTIIEHVPNSHIEIRTKFKIIDETWRNPDSVWLEVSVTKYKYTQAYLELLKEYRQLTDVVNPARRAAVEAQARKYARLKKEELIRKYDSNIKELQDYTFVALMKQMFGAGNADNQWSYYHGIVKSCIDWNRAHIEPEPASPGDLSANGLSPYHFLNVDAVRFFLPIHRGSEDAFFEAVSNGVEADWKALFERVNDYINQQRTIVEELKERGNADDLEQLTLDQYDSELVLGRHLEAVLSNHPFLES